MRLSAEKRTKSDSSSKVTFFVVDSGYRKRSGVGRDVDIRQIDERIWFVSFMQFDVGVPARAGGAQVRIFNDLDWITARRQLMGSQSLTGRSG